MGNRAWQLDERAHAGAEHLDPGYVAGYDAKSGTDLSDDVGALLALGVDDRSTVVDLGGGTGAFALTMRPHVARVVAVDVSETMVDHMRARGIEAVHAGFLSYEHAGDAPDAVYSRNALHHLPDFWKAIALDRIARLLPPGSVFLLRDLIFSFDPQEAPELIEAWVASAPEDRAQGWTGAELAEHVRGECSTYSWLLEPMLERVGFEIAERRVADSRTYASYTCVRRERAGA